MTMLMKKTMKQTALAMAIVFSLSGCAFAAPSHSKISGHGSTGHKITRQISSGHNIGHNNHTTVVRPAVKKVVRHVEPVHSSKTIVVHDTPRVVHHYDDRYCDSDNTGTAIAAGLVGLVLGAIMSNSGSCN